MLMYIEGNMFESPAQVLVNTVNTVGIMGKGVALTFKKVYPDMFKNYRQFCENKTFEMGKLYLYKTPGKWVLNFPTKINWRNPSKLEYIEQGLKKFSETYKEKGIKSIAFPKLGCGNGGLDFESQVKPLMDKYLSKLNDIDIYVYLQDMTTLVEHMEIKEMKKWLNSNIQNISILEFEKDLVEYSKGIANVKMEEECLIFNDQYIDNVDLLAFWEFVRNNNIFVQKEIIDKYLKELSKENVQKFMDVMDKIEYINLKGKNADGVPLLMYQPFKKNEGLLI